MILITGTFVPDDRIADGVLVAMRPLHSIVWAGPVTMIPTWVAEQENVTLHVHPAMFARIAAAVAKVEKGIHYEPGA